MCVCVRVRVWDGWWFVHAKLCRLVPFKTRRGLAALAHYHHPAQLPLEGDDGRLRQPPPQDENHGIALPDPMEPS